MTTPARRLDLELVARGLAPSRNIAQRLVAAGVVRVNGTPAIRSATPVDSDDLVEVAGRQRWVSRAGEKLAGILDELDPDNTWFADAPVVLDAGASTGGFTQVCLHRGAGLVHAIDVGHDQLDPGLRADPRVRVVEGFNLRHLTPDDLPGGVDLVVCDVSFISVRLLLEPLLSVLRPHGRALVMVKPQFEVGRERLGAGGVVSDPELQAEAVQAVREDAARLGWASSEPHPARITGSAGNQEFFLLLRRSSAAEHGR
ncbi:TlyA family RNA methyltransferase [Propionibacteriaceae bacterium Y1923]|uniref:TlyA family RNA methyltransferase n=1 Tax=Aestuariimicrobium sp. Y1814 TaxID=3418742 RepID=UPI003C182BDF